MMSLVQLFPAVAAAAQLRGVSSGITLQAALETTLSQSSQVQLGERQVQMGLGALLSARAPFDARPHHAATLADADVRSPYSPSAWMFRAGAWHSTPRRSGSSPPEITVTGDGQNAASARRNWALTKLSGPPGPGANA